MSNKIFSTILLLLFIFLLIIVLHKNSIEHFDGDSSLNESTADPSTSSNKWTTDKDKLALENMSLNNTQRNEVTNMINSLTSSQLKTLISTQSPLLTGPQGPPGIQGPPGTPLIASGRLVNKNGSFDNKPNGGDNNYFIPQYVVTRTEGTSKDASLSFMDNISPFASFQNWQLDFNNNLKNRYDGTCLTMDVAKDKLYMDKCNDSNTQKWSWDNSNRIISTSASTDRMLKCISLTKPELNVTTTNLPGCNGQACLNNKSRRYLVVKDCSINNMHDDEIWSFV
jgi:hypothetical protein